MKSYVKQEFRRAFLSKKTIVMYFFSICLFFIGMLQYLMWLPAQSVSIIYVFLSGYNSGTLSYLAVLFPLVSSIPFTTSYIEDCASGFNKFTYIRMKRRKYLSIRVVINALVGGATLVIGPILAAIFLLVFKLFSNAPLLKKQEQLETVDYFNQQGIQSPYIMMLVILSIIFICGLVIATFTLGLSTVFKNSYFTNLSIFALLLVSATVLGRVNAKLSLVSIYDVDHFGMTFLERFIYASVLLVIGLILIFKNGRKLEEKYA